MSETKLRLTELKDAKQEVLMPDRTPGYLHRTTWYKRWNTHAKFLDENIAGKNIAKAILMNMHVLVDNVGGYRNLNNSYVARLSLHLIIKERGWLSSDNQA